MHHNKLSNKGFAMVIVLAFTAIFLIIIMGVMTLVNSELTMGDYQSDSIKAFFLAEAGIQRIVAIIRDTGGIGAVPATFTLSQTTILNDATLDGTQINLAAVVLGGNRFRISANATIGNATRSITAEVNYLPQSQVFDYGYFLNNWGWFYGSGITANGDIRSNGRFDFQGSPTVEGEVFAGQGIGGGENVLGKAGTVVEGEYIYQHPYSDVMDMPNLQNLSYYEGVADEMNSYIRIGGITLVNEVYGDDDGETGNIVLIGTDSDPIEVSGPVVIRGDVVIRGRVTGQGTIYSGRNVYIAGNVEYDDPPSTPRPASDDQAVIDAWVNANSSKDIVGFAARENVVMGNYTNATGAYSWDWLTGSYLFGMGSEDVGQDGIPDTDDTGEDDGSFQSQYEDLDGDSVFDDNYQWSDLQTQTDIANFTNVPEGTTAFGEISTNNINKVEGIYYTNHAFAGWGNGIVFNGAIISKDEAIAAYTSITLNYDERTNSRYIIDPNWLIDLNLPVFTGVIIERWWE